LLIVVCLMYMSVDYVSEYADILMTVK